MWPRPRKHKSAPELPGEYIKFVLEKAPVDFLVPDLDLAPQPDRAPAANSSNREPYVLMHMPKLEARVAVPELTTAMDVADTPADALPPPTLGSASEATPKHSESPDEVTGLIERLSLPGAASDSDGGAGAGEGGGGALEIAMALKTEGNQHFSAGDCPSALPLYSAAIKMLEGAGADAVLATILCNRSVTFLKLGQPASALIDAERARELGGGKAHFRLAEALSSLGRSEEALEAYEAALANAVSHYAASRLFSFESLAASAAEREGSESIPHTEDDCMVAGGRKEVRGAQKDRGCDSTLHLDGKSSGSQDGGEPALLFRRLLLRAAPLLGGDRDAGGRRRRRGAGYHPLQPQCHLPQARPARLGSD
jgi:hypothetical protein